MSEGYVDQDFRWILYAAAHGYQGGHDKGGGVGRLAEDMGVPASILSRWISPYEADDQRFIPAERLVQLIRLTGCTEVLAHIAGKLDHLIAPYPKSKRRSGKDIEEFTRQFGYAHDSIMRFFKGDATRKEARVEMERLLRFAAGYRLAIKTHQQNQLPLEDNE